MILAQKTVYWSTAIPHSRLILSKTALLHALRILAASHLRSYPETRHVSHLSTRSRTQHLLVFKTIIFTTTTGNAIRVRRDESERFRALDASNGGQAVTEKRW